jgi:hypothetical protein
MTPGKRWIFAATMCLTGCATLNRGTVTRQPGGQDMKSAILGSVPVGSSIDVARQFMEREGFTCRDERNQTVNGQPGVDYLSCRRNDPAGHWVSQEWIVSIIFRDGHVTDVQVSSGLTGP